MKIKIFAVAALIATIFSSCTQSQMAKEFGGVYTIHLEKGKKLQNITWKDGIDLWILTRPMTSSDSSETYEFTQNKGGITVFGNGKVIIIESK